MSRIKTSSAFGRSVTATQKALSRADFDYEAQMAAMNQKMAPEVETIFLLPQPQLQCISSTLVREIAKLGGDVSQMVSPVVAGHLRVATLAV